MKAPVIQFHIQEGVKLKLASRSKLKEFIKGIFINEGKVLSRLTYVFCTDEQLLTINQEFLNHDTFTDVITFDLSENPSTITGEIYISVDRVKDNSAIHREEVQRELHRVIIHGALHLCGYTDKSAAEKKMMRTLEDEYLRLYLK